MRALCVLCVVAACGSGLKRDDTRVVARDVLAKAASDVAAMQRLLRGGVVNGGLWFEDPACATKFPVGEVSPPLLPELARCLVGLELQPSPREDALGDVVVMTYAPGFEIEARVVADSDGPRITWIGYEARREIDTLPTISGEALEALRSAGHRDGPLDDKTVAEILSETSTDVVTPDGPDGNAITMTWLKVCIDVNGDVTSADPYLTTSSSAEVAFTAAAKAWKFRPFTVRDRAIPVCAMSRLVYPPGTGPQPEVIPLPPPPSRSKQRPLVLATSKLLEGKRIAGTTAIVPDDKTKFAMYQAGLSLVESEFRICVDEAGAIESVLPMRSTGFAGYDARLITAMRQWRYSPYQVDGQPVPVCTQIKFKYRQDNKATSRRG
jgi:hypothetical protein